MRSTGSTRRHEDPARATGGSEKPDEAGADARQAVPRRGVQNTKMLSQRLAERRNHPPAGRPRTALCEPVDPQAGLVRTGRRRREGPADSRSRHCAGVRRDGDLAEGGCLPEGRRRRPQGREPRPPPRQTRHAPPLRGDPGGRDRHPEGGGRSAEGDEGGRPARVGGSAKTQKGNERDRVRGGVSQNAGRGQSGGCCPARCARRGGCPLGWTALGSYRRRGRARHSPAVSTARAVASGVRASGRNRAPGFHRVAIPN